MRGGPEVKYKNPDPAVAGSNTVKGKILLRYDLYIPLLCALTSNKPRQLDESK